MWMICDPGTKKGVFSYLNTSKGGDEQMNESTSKRIMISN